MFLLLASELANINLDLIQRYVKSSVHTIFIKQMDMLL